MKVARISNDGKLLIKGELIENEGEAYDFDGTDRVDIKPFVSPESNMFNNESFVFECEINHSNGSGARTIYSDTANDMFSYNRIHIQNSKLVVFFNNQGANELTLTSTQTIPSGVWTRIKVVRSGFNFTLYINDIEDVTGVWSKGNWSFAPVVGNTTNCSLGVTYFGWNFMNPFIGEMRDINLIPTEPIKLTAEGNLTTDKIIEYPIELEGGRNLLKGSNKIVSSGGEFNRFADLAPIIDKYGHGDEVKYSISFDLKSKDITNEDSITIYMQNGSGSKYAFFREDTWTSSLVVKATTEYQRFKLEGITFRLNDGDEIAAYLAFFGVWDTGNIPTVKNVKVELGSTATPWTPAPEDLGLWYSDDIQYFNMGIEDNILMVNEFIEDVPLNIDYNIPEGYVMAQDSDFSGTTNGSFRYIGSDLKIVIPNRIKGIAVTRYDYMFSDSSVIGVVSYNKNVTSMTGMFRNSKAITLDLSIFDTSNVTSMDYMFYGSSATTLDLSSFDTSNVTDMSSMFRDCSSLTSLDVSSFDTSNVTNMFYMFQGCSSLTSLDVSSFDTSNVTNMGHMFRDCRELTSLDLSSFDTSKVTNMGQMFNGCGSLISLNVSNFNTSKVTNMGQIFHTCDSLTSLDLSSFDTSNVTDMIYMFNGCTSLTSLDLSSFNTSNITDMNRMFQNCGSLISLDLSNFNTSNVTNMIYMFQNCGSLTSLDLSSFNTSNVTDMSRMFNGSYSITTAYARTQVDADKFNTSSDKPSNVNFIVK